MNNIVNLPPMVILYLAEAASRADSEGRTLRIATGSNAQGEMWVKWKIGEGVWTPPYFGHEEQKNCSSCGSTETFHADYPDGFHN